MNTEKTFEESCYDFQQEIINTVNNERNLPFLVKYFIIKEIWEDVQIQKRKIDDDIYDKKRQREQEMQQQIQQAQFQPEQVEGTIEEE